MRRDGKASLIDEEHRFDCADLLNQELTLHAERLKPRCVSIFIIGLVKPRKCAVTDENKFIAVPARPLGSMRLKELVVNR